jgi:putative transposase
MADFEVTLNGSKLKDLLTRDDGLQGLVEDVLSQVLEAQMTEYIGADRHERSETRQAYRNGHRMRRLYSRVGPLSLRVPQSRDGGFSTEIFRRYQRSEQALVLALMEMVVNGVSTRKVGAITEELCGASFSKSTVSQLCTELDLRVEAWNERPLSDTRYPLVIVDALVIKVRKDKAVRPISALIAIGISESGHREILGLRLGDSENEAGWNQMFAWLKQRGLSDVFLIVSDAHQGLRNAADRHFQGVIWQRCQVHFRRNVLGLTPKSQKAKMAGLLERIMKAEDREEAWKAFGLLAEEMDGKADKAVDDLENGLEDALAVLILPEKYRKRLRTTNMVERLNEEVRRRERVIRIFPNEDSAVRLIGALLAEQHETWSTGKRYLDMADFLEWKQEWNRKNEENSGPAKLKALQA